MVYSLHGLMIKQLDISDDRNPLKTAFLQIIQWQTLKLHLL